MIYDVLKAYVRLSFRAIELISRASSLSIVANLVAFLLYFDDLARVFGNYLFADVIVEVLSV